MSLLDNQKQHVGDGAVAVQSGRDTTIINNNGLTAGQVLSLCMELLKENFPKLQEIARETSEKYVAEFANEFETKILKNISSYDISKLASPDVQYDLNSAVDAAARRGPKSNYSLLSELIVSKLSHNTDVADVVISEAILVVPKLNEEQKMFLSMLCYFKEVTFNFNSIEELESFGRHFQDRFLSLSDMSRTSFGMLESLGLITRSNLLTSNVYKIFRKSYSFLDKMSDEEIESEFKLSAPCTYQFIQLYDSFKLGGTFVTPVGLIIGIENLRKDLPQLETKKWIY